MFSSKGDRPLADKLGGGDVDGDEYFVISNRELVGLTPSKPHDFGTQNPSIQCSVDISQAFCASIDHVSLDPPNIQNQLNVLEKFMLNGNLVGNSADAWLRLADKRGVADENVQKLAEIHQRALDSRKSYDTIGPSQLE